MYWLRGAAVRLNISDLRPFGKPFDKLRTG